MSTNLTRAIVAAEAAEAEGFLPETALKALRKDLRSAARMMSASEARYLVDSYYQHQDYRIAAANQLRSMVGTEPAEVLNHLNEMEGRIEKIIQAALQEYSAAQPVGKWLHTVYGIGPVIAAGLLAHLNIEKAQSVGAFWRFAGLDPEQKWEKGQKRPWNATLKTLLWKVGQSFLKFKGRDDCYYGRLLAQRWMAEQEKNTRGANVFTANAKAKEVGKTTESWAWYAGCYPASILDGWASLTTAEKTARQKEQRGEAGSGMPMLPPAHTLARATRWVEKLFLSHLFDLMFAARYGKHPPKAYVFEHMGHVHALYPPGYGEFMGLHVSNDYRER